MSTNDRYPRISIVTTCYNHADFIGKTIESILSQNYPNLEYIVIDDGSTDNSWEIIQRYADRLAVCESWEGYRDSPTRALNRGFEKTTGEILLFLNSDDILLPKSLFVIADIFKQHPEIEWITGMATTINERGEIVNCRLRPKNQYDFLIGNWSVIQQESTSWRRSLWQRTGGKLETEKKWAFDTELWTRFFEHAEHFHVTAPIGAFRKGRQSKSVSAYHTFLEPNLAYLDRFQKRATSCKKWSAALYRFCRFLRPIFSPVPNRLFSRIPFFSKFCYNVLDYNFAQDRWIITKKNPFRY